MADTPLSRSFYDRHVVEVARELLGKMLVRETSEGITSGKIVETEAYRSRRDPACHAARGRTRRNATMFGPPGHAYVYSIHAKYCFNVVTQAEGEPSAVLIRAIEPWHGIALMQQRRGREKLLELARGPARLCQAFALDTQHDGHDLTCGQQLWITNGEAFKVRRCQIRCTTRIGVSSGQNLKLRFFLKDDPFVSGPRRTLSS